MHRYKITLCMLVCVTVIAVGCSPKKAVETTALSTYVTEKESTTQNTGINESSTSESGKSETMTEDALDKAIKQLEELNDILEEDSNE